MEIKIDKITDWTHVHREALTTVNKNPKDNSTVSNKWKKSLLLSEHSPIRTLEYRIEWIGLKYWVAMELRTHQIGVYHPDDLVFISTQRDDRIINDIPRDKKPQDALVKMVVRLNAQSIINISRKRLCVQATEDARKAWSEALIKLKEIDPILVEICVEECVYRGFCPERNSCGYANGSAFTNKLLRYRNVEVKDGQTEGPEKREDTGHQCNNQKYRKKTRSSFTYSAKRSRKKEIKIGANGKSTGEVEVEQSST